MCLSSSCKTGFYTGLPIPSNLFVIAIKLKAKENIYISAMFLLYCLQRNYLSKICILLDCEGIVKVNLSLIKRYGGVDV
jgi:hypothetical protein